MPNLASRCAVLISGSCLLAFLACGADSQSDGAGAPAAQQGPFDTCTVDADCSYGEIDRELSSSSECTCLSGCGYVPLNRATIERRLQQHEALCDPLKEGQRGDCSIDDCAQPSTLFCIAGKCGTFLLNWGSD